MSLPVGTETARARVAECASEPDSPLTVMLDAPTAASAAAANVMNCGVPATRLSVDGEAVTPGGRPESEMFAMPVNPLTATAETAVCWPGAPVASARLVGLRLSRKSGAGATVTLSVKLAVCEREPDVPVNVMVLGPADAVPSAVIVTVCGVPGVSLSDAGVAVTPAGRPEMTTDTGALKPLIAVVVAETCWLPAPAVRAIVVGKVEREKSAMVLAALPALSCEPQPMALKARQFRVKSNRLKLTMREIGFCSAPRV